MGLLVQKVGKISRQHAQSIKPDVGPAWGRAQCAHRHIATKPALAAGKEGRLTDSRQRCLSSSWLRSRVGLGGVS